MYNVWALHDLLAKAETKPDPIFALGRPIRDVLAPQPQGESDLGDPAQIVCKVFHREVACEIHHSAHRLYGHWDRGVGWSHLPLRLADP